MVSAAVQPGSGVARRGRRKLLLLVIAFVILAGGAGAFWWRRYAIPQPPVVELQGVEPAVVTAIEHARAALLRAPRSAEAWGKLGMVLLAHQFREEARQCFAQAERLNPREVRWPYFQALILTREDLAAATLKLRRATELANDQPDAPRLRLAEALMVQGQLPEAKEHFDHLLAGQPTHPAAHLGLARLAFEEGRWQQSLHHLQSAKEGRCTQKAAHSLLATVYQRLGDPPAAAQEFRTVAHLPDDLVWHDPFNDEVAQLAVDRGSRMGQVLQHVNQGQVREAIIALHKLIATDPDWDLVWQCLGQVLLDIGEYAEAERALKVALRLTPSSADAHFYMGRALWGREQRAGALQEFRRARELQPSNAQMHHQIGHFLALKQDRAGAIEALTVAVRCQPDLAPAHKELGTLLVQEGRKEQALIHLRRVLELNPEDDAARKQVQDIETAMTTK